MCYLNPSGLNEKLLIEKPHAPVGAGERHIYAAFVACCQAASSRDILRKAAGCHMGMASLCLCSYMRDPLPPYPLLEFPSHPKRVGRCSSAWT
jgi:hypothetical protein